MNDNKEYTTLLADPLVRVDMGRITVADFSKMMKDNSYSIQVLSKCAVDDLDQIPLDYLTPLLQAWANELQLFLKDITVTRELFGGLSDGAR